MKIYRKRLSHSLGNSAKVSLIRAQIVPQLAEVPIIGITSAKADDGSQHLSYLLAESFHSCGERSLIIDFSHEGDSLLRLGLRVSRDFATELQSHILRRGEIGPDVLKVYVAANGALPGHSLLKALFSELTQHYKIVVMSLPEPMKNPHALFCLMHSTAILVAVRQGRSVCQQDLQLSQGIIEPGKGLGVVALEATLIDQDPSVHLGIMKPSMPTVRGNHQHNKQVVESLP